jgi:hypothetical protein
MRTVTVSTDLDAPADAVFAAVGTPGAFRLVTAGLVRLGGLAERDEPWQEGETVVGTLWLLGVVPFSRHRLRVEVLDPERRLLRSDEGGGAIRSWRHDITVEPTGPQRCHYRDVIAIDAGPLTPLVAAFAEVFYRARQRRWRRLAPVLAAVARRRLVGTGAT